MLLYNPTISGSLAVTGSLTTTGTITSQTLVVQTITSSVSYLTGSTQHGSVIGNTHQFTGSVLVTGSGTFSSKLSINNPVSPYANGITVGGTGTGIMMYSTSTGSQTSIQIINASNYNYGTIGVVSGTGLIAGDVYALGYTGNSNSTFTSVINWTSTGQVGIGTTFIPYGTVAIKSNNTTAYHGLNVFATGNGNFTYVNHNNNVGIIGTEFGTGGTGHTDLTFQAGGSERMRITTAGSVLINTTSLPSTGSFNSYSNSALPAGRFVGGPSNPDGNIILMVDKYSGTTSTSQWFLGFTVSNQSAASGVITANGASQAAFGSWSDRRLKENIVDLPNQLSNILALRPVEFDYIESEGGGHQVSFIAQEFEEIYPDAVGERPDGMKTLTGWGKTEAILVKAIQELSAKNAALEEILQRNNIQ
jgi:hypothetical protein